MDGARLNNAAVYLNLPALCIVRDITSATFPIIKGLGTPVGDILFRDKEFIRKNVSLYLIGKLNPLAFKLLFEMETQSSWHFLITSKIKCMSWSGLKTVLVVLHYKQF